MRVKICGLTTSEDAAKAIELGADALGFNFFPGSKRFVSIERARSWISCLPGGVEKIGVMVNPSWDEALAVAAIPGITALQLHGAESAQFCRRIKEEGIRFEKALPATATVLESAGDFPTETVVLDSNAGGEFGGSGRTFDWRIAADFVRAHPNLKVALAGGLTPLNVSQAIALVRPFGVDVTTGVESSAGRKDYERMREFISAVRGI